MGLFSRSDKPMLSRLNQRRLANFKANKRGYYSLWIFSFLFILSLFAEFIANDRPLIVWFKGELYAPVLIDYPETMFDGEFETFADYRDPFVQDLIIEDGDGWMIWPPIRYSYRTVNRDLPQAAPAPPSWTFENEQLCRRYDNGLEDRNCTTGNFNLLGTNDRGNDILAIVIYGFRISVLFGLVLTIFSSIIGIVAGAIQGYFGGWTDLLIQRFIEIWNSIPSLYLLIIVASILEPNFWLLVIILLLFSWVSLVGVVRAEFLRARNFEYVKAARALGVTDGVIMFKHLLPNAMVATLTFAPFILSASITSLTSLDFFGFGLPPGSASLGELIGQARRNPTLPWLGLTSFFVLSVMLSLLIFIGEGIRDAFDPRKNFVSDDSDQPDDISLKETAKA